MEENPFIRTSPDSNVDCSCCGRGLLEVTIEREKREKTSHENLSFLTLGENDKVTLKQNHPFFYQVQGQMGVTGKNHCDFFVYTHFGIHQERITLNSEIWKNIFQTLQQFWYKYLAPEILLQKLQAPPESIALHDQAQAQTDKSKIYTKKNDSATSPVPKILTQNALKRKLCNSPKNDSPSNILDLGQPKPVKSKLCVTTCKNDFGLSNVFDPAQSKAVKRKVSDPAKNAKKRIFYCDSCENILKDKPKVCTDFCVACVICDVWFHYKCVGIPREKK